MASLYIGRPSRGSNEGPKNREAPPPPAIASPTLPSSSSLLDPGNMIVNFLGLGYDEGGKYR